MKNFKKVLALVLAIATLLSFATVASAKTADFTDAADVANVEAVDVLSYIKVLEGYPADNSFKPAKNITREEAAKIIAIFANGSADISTLYTSANPFVDEKGRWGESYVAYGYRAGIIAGKSATEFKPTANVKGTEFLKMVLVVLGYDANKEGLVGSSWAVNTLELSKAKGLLKGLGSSFDPNAALTRDQAAQIMLNALKAETVVYGQTVTNLVWNSAAGYWQVNNTVASAAAVYVSPNGAQNNYSHDLLAAKFGLKLTAGSDKWGRPTHTWSKSSKTIGSYINSDELVKSYNTAVTECTVASDYGFTTTKTLPVYVNGQAIGNYTMQAKDTVGTIGAQGRLTEVYEDRIVMIDTFLAKVTSVSDAKFDAAGHLVTDSGIQLTAYGSSNVTLAQTNGSTNYAYANGDYVLVNSYTEQTNGVSTSGDPVEDQGYFEIVGKASSIEGAQTIIYYNSGKHTVEGTTYDDAMKFYLGNAGNTKTTKHTWFMDSYGNLIGAVEVATVYSYGVVTDMWWVNDATNGSGKALANIRFMDDSTNTVTVSSVNTLDTVSYKPAYADTASTNNMMLAYAKLYVSTNAAANKAADASNADLIDGHLFKINTLADGTVALTKVDNASGAHAEIANAKVTNKYPVIAGTGASITVDASTKFLIATPVDSNGAFALNGTYTYTMKTGMNEMPTFKTAAKVDYVLGDDTVADYVYIIGELAESTSKDFVLFKGQAYSSLLKTDGGVEYNEVYIPVPAEDGSQATVKVRVGQKNGSTTDDLLTVLTNAGNTGKLYRITFSNGYAVSATACDNLWWYENGAATGNGVLKLTNATMPSGVENGTLMGNFTYAGTSYSNAFNVTSATKVIGDLAANMNDKTLYLIFSGVNNNVEKMYILDNAGSAITPAAPTTINSVSISAAATPAAGVPLSKITVNTDGVTADAQWFDATAGAYVAEGTLAVAGHKYTVHVTNVAAKAGYVLAAGYTCGDFVADGFGGWTYTGFANA